jgi:predicted MFS family arabinose efflux permease
MHLADQIALVSVPLIAALAFDASVEVIGILVACQSLAHLVGSIPFGILVDNVQQRSLAVAASLMSLFGFSGAAVSVLTGSVFWFGGSVTIAGFGVVLFVLAALSIIPKVVPAKSLARANAAVEIPRAVCSFAVPLIIGLIVTDVAAVWVFCVAALGAVAALAYTLALPSVAMGQVQRRRPISQIREGAIFVLRHNILLPISLCAIFWNLAFSALLVVLVPLIREVYLFDPGAFGIALSAFGLAMILGTWIIGQFADRVAPNVILLFGPGSSVLAVLGMYFLSSGSSEILLYACFFLLGFGPSMWLITQNSVRQLVTQPAMLGRVNAVIQTAIYGVRPLGALAAGAIVGGWGPQSGVVFVVCAYSASFVVSLFSKLSALKQMPQMNWGMTGNNGDHSPQT